MIELEIYDNYNKNHSFDFILDFLLAESHAKHKMGCTTSKTATDAPPVTVTGGVLPKDSSKHSPQANGTCVFPLVCYCDGCLFQTAVLVVLVGGRFHCVVAFVVTCAAVIFY